MSETIFVTIHGSRLYGFDHESSDRDVFAVTTSRAAKAKHVQANTEDRVEVGLAHFLNLATSGSHQSVEALFSPYKLWGNSEAAAQYRPMLESIRVGGVAEKFERTIRKFSYGDFKRRRHACRLSLALDSLRVHGQMNPALNAWQIGWCNRAAELEGDELARALFVYKEGTE